MLVLIQKGVLLLDPEPRVLVLGLLHDLVALLPVVGLGGLLVVLEGLAQDDLVVAQAERVPVHGHGIEVDVGVGALGLAGGGAIKVPDGELCVCADSIFQKSWREKQGMCTRTIERGSYFEF